MRWGGPGRSWEVRGGIVWVGLVMPCDAFHAMHAWMHGWMVDLDGSHSLFMRFLVSEVAVVVVAVVGTVVGTAGRYGFSSFSLSLSLL